MEVKTLGLTLFSILFLLNPSLSLDHSEKFFLGIDFLQSTVLKENHTKSSTSNPIRDSVDVNSAQTQNIHLLKQLTSPGKLSNDLSLDLQEAGFIPGVGWKSSKEKRRLLETVDSFHQRSKRHVRSVEQSFRKARETVSDALDECGCISDFILDFLEVYEWKEVGFILSKYNVMVSSHCLRKSLLQISWKKHRRAHVIKAERATNRFRTDIIQARRLFVAEDNNDTRTLLTTASELQMLPVTTWLIITNSHLLNSLKAFVSLIEAFIPSELFPIVFQKCTAELLSVYRVGPSVTEVQQEYGGTWNMSHGFTSLAFTEDKLNRRMDFKGYPMRGTGVAVFEFFTTYLRDGSVSGYVGDLVTALQVTHNFTLKYTVLPGYSYGTLVGSNKWNGMVGELQNKRVDITVSEVSVIRERADVMTFSQPVRMISRKLFVAMVEDNRKKILTYFAPMEKFFYVSTAASLVIISIFLLFIDKATHALLPQLYDRNSATTFATAFWYMLSALVQQGCELWPKAYGPRIVFWFGFIMFFLLYTAYSCTLVSLLAVEIPAKLPFSNLRDLTRLPNWNAGCNKNDLFQVTASQTCAPEPRGPECQILYDTWNINVMRDAAHNVVNNYTEGLKRVLEGQFVFIGVGVTTRYYIERLPASEGCKVLELPGMYIQGGIAIGLQYKSPFAPSFDRSLQMMREGGVMDKLVRRWLNRDMICESTNIVVADLIDVSSLFVLLMLGIGFSLVVFAGEKGVWWWRKKGSPSDEEVAFQ